MTQTVAIVLPEDLKKARFRRAFLSSLQLLPATETVICYDTDGAAWALPPSLQVFLAYDDGNPIVGIILQRFPHATPITITTVAQDQNLAARMCDCEASGFTPAQAAFWAHLKIEMRRERPTIYLEGSQKDEVGAALAVYGLEWGRDVDCFLAWWNDIPEIPEGIFEGVGTGVGNIGIQYLHNGNLYDASVVLLQWITGPWPQSTEDSNVKSQIVNVVPGANGQGQTLIDVPETSIAAVSMRDGEQLPPDDVRVSYWPMPNNTTAIILKGGTPNKVYTVNVAIYTGS